MEQNSQPPPSPQHVPWSQDPVPPSPAIDPNDPSHLLAHITTFRKDPMPSLPYHQIMDAGFDPNTRVISQSTSLGAQEGRADYKWLLSSQDLPQGSVERQGSAPNRHHHLPPIETLTPLPEASMQSIESSVQYTQPSVQELTSLEVAPRTGLSENTKRFIREALANLRAIRSARTPNILPDITRQIIRETVAEWEVPAPLAATPEVIFVRSSSLMEPCDVVILPSRPESVASQWTRVTHETNESDLTRIARNQFPELKIRDFLESINEALRAPVLTEPVRPSREVDWEDEEGSLERIRKDLMVELGWDVSESQMGYAHFYLQTPLQFHKDNDFPVTVEDLNLSTALVVAALDCGVEDHRGDLELAGVTPSSWFRLASAVLGAIARGALRSGGRKIQGRVALHDDNGDDWQVADGVHPPVTQGGRVAAQAQQIAQFFSHYAGTDEPPLADFYNSVIRIGQNHIEKVVRLKAAATYQITTADVQGLTDMVLDDMSKQLYTHMVNDADARKRANQLSLDRLFADAKTQLEPFMDEWKMIYRHSLIQATKKEEDREDTPVPMDPILAEKLGYIKLYAFNTLQDIRDSIAQDVTDPLLDGDEISRTRERIRINHAEEIEAARRDTHAQISSEKKAWAVAYWDSVKLDWLTKAAEELGYVLISKDDAEQHEGRTAKRHAGPVGKRERSSSRVSTATPSEVPATPENQPRLLDTSQTPTARKKTKGKRVLAPSHPPRSRSHSISSQPSDLSDVPDVDMVDIKKPLFFASSYPAISGISIPAEVRPSQAPEAPLRDPRARLSEPATDVSVYMAPAQIKPSPEPAPPSQVLTPDSTRGVASSMHNPDNAMADDHPPALAPEAIVVPPALPSLQPIPLLPGLAEMLNALQANLMTSFTSQINNLSSRIDAQDEIIKIRVQPKTGGKGKTGLLRPNPPSQPQPQPHSSEVLLVPDPLPVPRPPPIPPHSTRPPHAILPEKTTWAGVVTPGNFGQDQTTRQSSRGNANIIGRTAGGATRKGKANPPVSIDNTEITITRGVGLQDKSAEEWLYKSNPGGIVQAARSAMEYADGFTTVGKGGKDASPSGATSRNAKKTKSRQSKKAAKDDGSSGLPTAGPSNPNTNGAAQGSSVMNVLFPEDVATITETMDAFRKLAYAVCDGSKEDLQRAMTELERGWGVPTEHLDNLFGLPARYAVKHNLPLTVPQTEDTIAGRGGEGGLEKAAERVQAFRAAWGSTQPVHFVYHSLPASTRFATEDEVDARRIRQAKTSDRMRQFNDAIQFTIDLSRSLFENNITTRPLSTLEAEVVVTTNSLETLFSLDNPGPIGDRVADQIKTHLQQDSARLFSLASITSYA
ncbi:hypothetical protein BJY52DRAFT_1191623 [Lactarius psammicola]|nr:hypothetical protein BJY52DRAFT_1191623 [Lactarius psammicola]